MFNAADRIKCVKDTALVKRDEPKSRIGSGLLFAPDGEEVWPQTGTVLAIGPGRVGPDGEYVPMAVKVGDRVIFKNQPDSALVPDHHDPGSMPDEWKRYIILDEAFIFGVIEEE